MSRPADVPKPQSVPAITLSRPTMSAYRTMRWATTSGCSMKFVVESITPYKPDPQELRDMAIAHAGIVLGNGLADRFGVTTGPGAYDNWTERLRTSDAKLPSCLLEITDD